MVVKILSASATFNGISYNTNKIDSGKGELMAVSGFGPLQGLGQLRPEDYRNYLKMVSAQNRRLKGPQFHAAISAQGKTYDKTALTSIAVKWMEAMGYAEQPYLVVYHKDTENNHVHIVSTRIDRNGKKISSGFEHIRAIQNLNRAMGIDEKHTAKQDISNALAYNFSTKAQFMMTLESQGYTIKDDGDQLAVIKFGIKQAEVEHAQVAKQVEQYMLNSERQAQLKALFRKYAAQYDTTLKRSAIPMPSNYQQKLNGYTSDFAALMKEKFGLVLVFHASGDKPPYGYSIIDHSEKAVFKGSEIVPLRELLTIPCQDKQTGAGTFQGPQKLNPGNVNQETVGYYAALLKAALYNYPDLTQGLRHHGLSIVGNTGNLMMADQISHVYINCKDLLNGDYYRYLEQQFGQETGMNEDSSLYQPIQAVNIASDVDDEAVHGRKRRKQSYTNSR